jgi:hypothetical protein
MVTFELKIAEKVLRVFFEHHPDLWGDLESLGENKICMHL